MVTKSDELPICLSVEAAGRLLGLSRGSSYLAVKTGQLPHVRIGQRIIVPTARLLAMLAGNDAPANGE